MSESCLLLSKVEELDIEFHKRLLRFIKEERFFLVKDFRETFTRMERNIISAYKKSNLRSSLREIDVDIEYLRFLLRKSVKLDRINVDSARFLSFKIDELGKILGSWMKK